MPSSARVRNRWRPSEGSMRAVLVNPKPKNPDPALDPGPPRTNLPASAPLVGEVTTERFQFLCGGARRSIHAPPRCLRCHDRPRSC
jgi:hypothetical protein